MNWRRKKRNNRTYTILPKRNQWTGRTNYSENAEEEDCLLLAVKKNLDPDSWESLKKTLPLLRYRKYYKKSKYGYCRGTEPIIYTKRIVIYYKILKRQDTEYKEAQAKL